MAALIMVRPGRDWQSSGGLFDWTLEYLIPRLSDEKTAESLRTVVEENLGSLWIPDLPSEAQIEIFQLIRAELLPAAEAELPPAAVAELRELIALTY
ncbi:hypothetical protein [Paractinoplanes durhamensis]|uniref:Uncharacterized protein n=1 Tax=Paractinoplanes durhamensis TaxID=113563 RepID=A0ABQ3ZBH6_9ACTN|nr:hypothetical protein [Actinoplanes durhamensis]GIE07193.1 hypothetical protein Adu01nite_85430 [Actinoplanes durhamensis]